MIAKCLSRFLLTSRRLYTNGFCWLSIPSLIAHTKYWKPLCQCIPAAIFTTSWLNAWWRLSSIFKSALCTCIISEHINDNSKSITLPPVLSFTTNAYVMMRVKPCKVKQIPRVAIAAILALPRARKVLVTLNNTLHYPVPKCLLPEVYKITGYEITARINLLLASCPVSPSSLSPPFVWISLSCMFVSHWTLISYVFLELLQRILSRHLSVLLTCAVD